MCIAYQAQSFKKPLSYNIYIYKYTVIIMLIIIFGSEMEWSVSLYYMMTRAIEHGVQQVYNKIH